MNNKRLLIALGVIGASYAFWRFYLKDKLADKKATKAINDRAMFDANRELRKVYRKKQHQQTIQLI
jgi:hypothetical protein